MACVARVYANGRCSWKAPTVTQQDYRLIKTVAHEYQLGCVTLNYKTMYHCEKLERTYYLLIDMFVMEICKQLIYVF